MKNNMQLKLSIIVATMNSSRGIEKTISSILKQNYQNIEVIFVDNCSSDNTLEIINHYTHKNCLIILSPTKIGNISVEQWPSKLGINTLFK